MAILKPILILFIVAISGSQNAFCDGIDNAWNRLREIRKRVNHHLKHTIKTINSEDGEIIDCVEIHKQPAFRHPALKNHKIQMVPSGEDESFDLQSNKPENVMKQVWEKYGSCPEGTVPTRRVDEQALLNSNSSIEDYGRKPIRHAPKNHTSNSLYPGLSVSILLTGGYSYTGGKADMPVYNPFVEREDEYSLAQIALRNGPWESVQAGWGVNPSLYRDHKTHFFVSFTADQRRRGCFDLTCPGFVQTSRRIALGGAIDLNRLTPGGGLGGWLVLWIEKDVITGNWWVRTGNEKESIGYYPGKIFAGLQHTADTVQWGGEVRSKFIEDVRPHTRTTMGNGVRALGSQSNGAMELQLLRIRTNNPNWVIPDWFATHSDEFQCYRHLLIKYDIEPLFYFGGPGRNPRCP